VETCAGVVVDAATDAPIGQASVALVPVSGTGSLGTATTTEKDGRFQFTRVTPGEYRLYASRNGYIRQEYGAVVAGEPGRKIKISSQQSFTNIRLRIVHQGVISGRVTDLNGEGFRVS